MKRIFRLLLIAVPALDIHAQTCYPLDTIFGISGKAIGISNMPYWYDTRNLIVQPDNKIIQFLSSPSNQFTAHRYKADGKPDSSFGQFGKIAISSGRTSFGALQGDGKIVIAGSSYLLNNNYPNISLLRINSNGTLDNSFGGTGIVSTFISSNHDAANGVAIQPDGKIVAVGYSSSSCFNDCNGWLFCKPYLTVVRYNNNGTPDTSFGQNGIIAIGVGNFNSGKANSVVIQPDGKIVVAGESHSYYCDDYYGGSTYSSGFIMVRFNPDGSPDASFGQNGQVRDSIDMMTSTAFAIQPDGKFLTAGYNYNLNNNTLRRYNSNGTIDNGFITASLHDIYINSIAMMPNGKIVIGGRTQYGLRDFMIVRLNNDGQFDSSFNLNGKLSVHVGSSPISEDVMTGIAIQGNHIIAGGYSYFYNSNNYFYSTLVVRLADSIAGIAVPITPPGPIYPCQGFSTILTANGQGTYQWYKDGVMINGAMNQQYSASVSGNYSVKISNASGCGHSEPALVWVNGLPVNIIPYGSTNICPGDSVKLRSSEAGTLQWFLNGNPINNATDTILWAKVQGNYFVRVNSAKGCGFSGYIYVTVSASNPPVTWNGSFLLTLNGYTGYQWFLNGNAIPGATAPTLQPDTPGVYKVIISDFGCSTNSDEFPLNCTVIAVQKPVIVWTGSELNTSPGYIGYQWYLDNNPIANATSSTLIPQQTGIYRIDVKGPLDCSNTSNNFTLSCNEVGPSKPTITWDGTKFFTGPGYASYQWYYNDTAIIGATSPFYTPPASQFGKFKVQVSNSYNCYRFSDEKYNALTAIVSIGQAKFSYYPNPANTVIYIDVSPPFHKNMTAVIYDLNGKVLVYQLLKQGHNQVPVKNIPSGLYHMEIRSGNEKTNLKLAVIK